MPIDVYGDTFLPVDAFLAAMAELVAKTIAEKYAQEPTP